MAEVSLVEQQIAVCLPGQLQAGAGSVDCEVLVLSRRGAQLRLLRALGSEREALLTLGDFGRLPCRVVDLDGDRAEVRFLGDDEAQDALFQEIIARLGDDEGRRRYLRRSVLWPGTLTCGREQLACTILNMSLGGAKVALGEPRDCAGTVTLLGDRFEGLPATVVWQRGRLVGLQFRGDSADVARVLGDLLPAIRASA